MFICAIMWSIFLIPCIVMFQHHRLGPANLRLLAARRPSWSRSRLHRRREWSRRRYLGNLVLDIGDPYKIYTHVYTTFVVFRWMGQNTKNLPVAVGPCLMQTLFQQIPGYISLSHACKGYIYTMACSMLLEYQDLGSPRVTSPGATSPTPPGSFALVSREACSFWAIFHAHIYIYIYICILYIYMYIYIYMHNFTHTHIYIYIHIEDNQPCMNASPSTSLNVICKHPSGSLNRLS